MDEASRSKNRNLLRAAKDRDVQTVELLLSSGAQCNARDNDGRTALMTAVDSGQVDVVQLLLASEGDCNASDSLGWTALMHAAFRGRANAVQLLLSKGAACNASDNNGRTALMHAAKYGHVDAVRLLLSGGSEYNASDNMGWTALMRAAYYGQGNVVQLLLSNGAECNADDNDGRTAFMFAAFDGHVDVVQLLLSSGAECNASDNDGWTALMRAAFFGHEDIVQLLLPSGAECNGSDNDGRTALMHAAVKGHTNIVQLLLSSGAECNGSDNNGWTPLMRAAKHGHVNVIQLLLSSGAECNDRDNKGRTALMWAAKHGHVDVIQLLLSSGAEYDASDKKGRTSLIRAADKGHVKVVKELITGNADCDAADKDGFTALLHAAKNNHHEVADILLSSNANCNVSNKDGWTPLMYATSTGNFPTILNLLVFGTDCDARNKDELTPLLIAADNRDEEAISMLHCFGNCSFPEMPLKPTERLEKPFQALRSFTASWHKYNDYAQTCLMLVAKHNAKSAAERLLSCGVDGNKCDVFGVTALMTAAEHGHHNIVQALLFHGADYTAADMDGQTALIFAVKNGHRKTVKVLLEAIAKESQQLELHVNKKDHFGKAALHYAIQNKDLEIVQLLLDNASDPSISNNEGDTFLHIAAHAQIGCKSGIVQCLVQHFTKKKMHVHSYLEKQNKKGLTPLDLYINLVNVTTINDDYKETVGYLLSTRHAISKMPSGKAKLFLPSEEHISNCKRVIDILEIPFIGNLHETNDDVTQKVSSVVDMVCQKIGQINQEFDSFPIFVGSSSSGTKIALPDEYDFLLVLRQFSSRVSVKKTNYPGLVRIHSLYDGTYLPVTIKDKFIQIACQAAADVFSKSSPQCCLLASIEYNKVCLTFNVVYYGDFYEGLSVAIDFSPAIEIGYRKLKASTSFASFEKLQNVSCQAPVRLHAVCKPLANLSDDCLWTMSSSERETSLIQKLPESRKRVIRLTKVLMKGELYGKALKLNEESLDNTFDDVNVRKLFNILKFQPNKLIDSYLIKTAFLREVNEISEDALWDEENTVQRTQSIFQYISTCCRDRFMAHCMVNNVNVLEEYARKKIEGVLLLYLTSLCADGIGRLVENDAVPTKRGVVNLSDEQIQDLYLQIRQERSQKRDDVELGLSKADKMSKFKKAWKKLEESLS